MADPVTTPAPAPTPAPGGDYNTAIQQALQQILGGGSGAVTGPPAPATPAVNTNLPFASMLGEALGGGVSPLYPMSEAQQTQAGNAALLNFGIQGLMNSSGPVRHSLGQVVASGLLGAQGSLGSVREAQAQAMALQQKQQELQLERLKEAMPLLQMQYGASIPNPLLSANTPAVPGTATGGGKPGGGGLPAVAYGQGGPGASIPVPTEYMPLFEAAAKRTGVPVDLLIAQARQESGFNPNAAGGGLMQIQDKTALKPGFGMQGVQSPAILKDPATNINFGADYLAARAKAIGADLNTPQGQALALREYNGGGDPDYAAHVTRYMPAAPQATAGATQPPAPYKVATTGNTVPGPPSGSTGAPAATPPAPGQTPPAAPTTTADATTSPPPGEPTFEQFRAQNPIDPASLMPDLAQAKAAQAAAAQQLSLARAGRGGDPNKSLSDYNTATDAVNKLQQEANAKVLDTQRQLYDAHQQRQAQAGIETQKIEAAAAEAERQRQAALNIEQVKAGITQRQKQADADVAAGSKLSETYDAYAAHAGEIHTMLAQLGPNLQNLPQGFAAQLMAQHPGLVTTMANAGLIDPKTRDAVQLVTGLNNYLSVALRPLQSGSLRSVEMEKFQGALPNMLQSPAGQQKALAFLLNMTDRVQKEADYVRGQFHRQIPDPTNPNATVPAYNLPPDLFSKMDKDLGPVLPHYSGGAPTDATAADYQKYVQSQKPGMPYYGYTRVVRNGQPVLDKNGRQVMREELQVAPEE